MTLKRALIHRLDIPGCRWLLAWALTLKARQSLQENVEIRYDGMWQHRFRSYIVPDGPTFDYYEWTILSWRQEISNYLRNAADFWFVDYHPKAGDVIIDVGAGRGEDTLTFSKAVGPTGRVIAIEADPLCFRILERFCTLNHLLNVTPIHAAVMDKPQTVTIRKTLNEWRGNSVMTHGAGPGVPVAAQTLDQICEKEGLGKIDFLKMNIEGAETPALTGATHMMQETQNVSIACHDFRAEAGHGEAYRTLQFVEKFLKQHNFVLSRRLDDPRDFVRDHVYGRRIG